MSPSKPKRHGRAAAFMLTGLLSAFTPQELPAQRQMENLGRGVVAVRKNSTEAFISWRLLALDPSTTSFNLYRSANGGAAVKLNASPLTAGTNYTDTTANLSVPNAYHVRPVIGGVEQAASAAFTLPANTVAEPLFRIPLQTPANRMVHNVWVGDVDGDGEYEYFACWLPTTTGLTQKLQAYKRDGTLLWEVDFGPNSVDSDNIYVSSATVAAGQWDGITVYDMDGDGRAEVIVKSANGVTFGDGATVAYGDNVTQFISVLNGQTGVELTRALLPNPWLSGENRPLGTLFGIGYPDGIRPSLMIHAKSREGSDGFHQINSAWDYRGGILSQRWSKQWSASDPASPPNNHQMRLLDLNGDGTDEMMPGMYALNANGTLRYDLGDHGIVHGDRFHVGDLNPHRPGLEHYGIQQYNPTNLIEFMADASTGQPIWMHTIATSADSARGSAVDIDPAHPGSEVWSFYGIRTATGTEIATEPNRPYPNLTMWWDGDLLGENLHEEQIEKWNPATQSVARLLTGYHYDAAANGRKVPVLYGDILGDWREEIVQAHWDQSELLVFTTTTATSTRLYTLAQNPAYRNCLTVKGYVQQNIPDYFLGDGMATPPTPDIVYTVNIPPATLPGAPGNLAASAVSGNQINLSWSDNSSNETLFKIERSTDGVYFTQIATVGTNVTSYSNTGLAPSTAYSYRVRAFNSGGNSTYSNTVSAMTIDDPNVVVAKTTMPGVTVASANGPTLATSSSFSMGGGNTVALIVTSECGSTTPILSATFAGQTMTLGVSTNQGNQWSGIFYLINPSTTTGQFVITSSNSTTTGLAYSAIALGNVSAVSDSDSITSTSTDTAALFPVTYTTTTGGGYVLGSFANNGYLTSNDPGFVSGRASELLLPSTIIGSSGHLHTYGQVPTAGTYTDNYNGQYQRSALVTLAFASGAAAPTIPAAPASPSATTVSASQIDLSWTASGGATSYHVKRSTTSDGPYTTIASSVSSTNYSNTGLTASTTYHYVVSAVNSAGESGNSAQASATTSVAPTPTFVAAGAVASGAGTLAPPLPAGIQIGDILLLFVETGAQSGSITNQNGGTWAAITGAQQSTGTAGGTNGTQINVFWSRYNGTQGTPTVSDSGNHQLARLIAIRGAIATGNPWNVVAGGVESTSDTSGSIPGSTTTVANTLVVVAVAANLPDSNGTSQFSGWTNSNLTNLTERTDNTTNAGNGGGLGIATGTLAGAGAYGATTVTHANSAAKAMVSIAIRN